MVVPSQFLLDDKLATSQSTEICFYLNVTGGALTFIGSDQPPAIVVDANGDSSQAAVNTLLQTDSTGAALSASSTAELDYATACGSTALGTDAFAIICRVQQVKSIRISQMTLYNGASSAVVGAAIGSGGTTVPPNTLTNYAYVTPAGNLFLRGVITGLDAATANILVVKAHVVLK